MPAISRYPSPVALTAITLAALLLAGGCDKPGDDTEPQALKPRQESLEQHAPGCSAEEECASVSVTYQLFEKRPALNETIRQRMAQQLQGFAENGDSADSIPAAAAEFLEQAARLPDDSGSRWQLQGEGKLLDRNGDLATIQISSYAYTGGAHGMPATHWLNWDLRTDEAVTLEQLIQPGQEETFWNLARAAHQRWLDEEADIDEEFREGWPFSKTDDFRLSDKGLILLYGVYTLGPYAMGQIELTIPRDKLDGVIRRQYLADN